MKTFSDVARGRDNNFNLVRIIAAFSVLVSHCFSVATGDPYQEPFRRAIEMTPGTIAVDIFFITSGFLVTGSLLRRPHLIEFAWARFLRIFPALAMAIMIMAILMGPAVTDLSPAHYFKTPLLYVFIAKGLTLFFGVQPGLPGVFLRNPIPDHVDSPLWTMPYEVRMYAILAVLWLLGAVAAGARLRAFKIAVLILTPLALAVVFVTGAIRVEIFPLPHLFYMFFVGASGYILKERLPFSFGIAVALAIALAASLFAPLRLFGTVYLLTLPYLVLYAAYAPTTALHAYNKLGDYSYGIYILAWPIQQLAILTWPHSTPIDILLIAGPTTAALAALSWHFIEHRALSLKSGPPFGLKVLMRGELAPESH